MPPIRGNSLVVPIHLYVTNHTCDELAGGRCNAGGLALAGTGDVKNFYTIGVEPPGNLFRLRRIVQINCHARFAVASGKLKRQFGAAAYPVAVEYQRGVGIEYVSLGPHRVLWRVGLVQFVSVGNTTVFGQPAARTPPAVRNARCNRSVQRTTIHAVLSAGNDFHEDKNGLWSVRSRKRLKVTLFLQPGVGTGATCNAVSSGVAWQREFESRRKVIVVVAEPISIKLVDFDPARRLA